MKRYEFDRIGREGHSGVFLKVSVFHHDRITVYRSLNYQGQGFSGFCGGEVCVSFDLDTFWLNRYPAHVCFGRSCNHGRSVFQCESEISALGTGCGRYPQFERDRLLYGYNSNDIVQLPFPYFLEFH